MIEWYSLVHLDRMFVLTGVHAGGVTTWTLPVADETLDTIVLGPDFGDDAGKIVAPDSVVGTAVTLAGDHTAGDVAIGRSYVMSVELSRPYQRDAEGNADITALLLVRQVSAMMHNAGAGDIRITDPLRDEHLVGFDVDPIARRKLLTSQGGGNAEDIRIFLENRTPKPSTFTAVEIRGDHEPRLGG